MHKDDTRSRRVGTSAREAGEVGEVREARGMEGVGRVGVCGRVGVGGRAGRAVVVMCIGGVHLCVSPRPRRTSGDSLLAPSEGPGSLTPLHTRTL